ncbi:MAG TPA: GGDEF domain-containing protein [Bacteriovoracaceae bacterium]|nr:GGDEF domain-containing protein [Bacteriovoracaceae bacterium]
MNTKPDDRLEVLAIGLDSFSIESIKKSLRENRIKYRISFIQGISELEEFSKKTTQAVFFYSNRQSQKTIDDIRKINQFLPRAALTLLCPRPDHQGIVGAFRAGLFDFLTLPIDTNEIRTVIYRLKLHGAIQSGQWTPERAVLHLFSRPESFSSMNDVANGLNQYLSLFFKIEKDIQFNADAKALASLQSRLKLTAHQLKRIKRFLADDTGLVFGLRFFKDKFYFLIKKEQGKLCYLVGRNTSDFNIKEILSDYLANVIKTSLSILIESKLRDKMKLLTLIDEVTGLFNQRKLVEDLEYYVSRHQHDQQGFSLLFVDIDHFKNVNDNYGHVIGSQLLIDMAEIIKTQLRSTDLVYRYGGDEFIVLLPRTTLDVSKRIALRMSQAVKDAEFNIGEDKKYRLSLSVGIASFPEDATNAKSIIDFADKMMYMSKKNGRGKVFHVNEVVA